MLFVVLLALLIPGVVLIPGAVPALAQEDPLRCFNATETWHSGFTGNGPTDPAEPRDPRTEFSVDGGMTWSPAFIVTPRAGWATPIPSSNWISVSANRSGPVNSSYRASFNVQGAFLWSQSVIVRVHADNWVTISLNGTVFGQQPASPVTSNFRNPPEVFWTLSNMRPGNNVLRFDVRNQANTDTGLDYEVRVWHLSCNRPPPPDGVLGPG
jgi:hypothetical protein